MCGCDNRRCRSEHQHMYIVSSLAICKYELYVSIGNIELFKLSGKFFMILEIHMHSLCLDIVL